MAFSDSQGRRMTVGRIIKRGFNVAGIKGARDVPLTAEEIDLGKDLLEEILDEIDAHGVSAKTQEFEDVTLVSGTYIYTMPSHVLNVFGPGMYADPNAGSPASSETYVLPITTEDWHMISSKSATGRPNQYTPWRNPDDLEIRLWPIPSSSEDGGTIRFMTHVHMADSDDTTATLELEPYWMKYVFFALAHQLCEAYDKPPGVCARKEHTALRAFQAARTFSRQHPPEQMVLSHRTPSARVRW